MGILGLTTFMKNNSCLHRKLQLHSRDIVIDGNSLYHFIFYKNEVEFLHGGDYDHYALKIREFFSLLQSCNIQPYVVLDGGNEPNAMKFETTRRRMKYRQDLVNRLATNKKKSDDVVPILAFDTFKAVLHEINIGKFAVCDFEADKEIALLANKLNCPVLSSDSDFFILPLRAGFIHFDWVNLTPQKIELENGSSDYLHAEIYFVDEFVEHFPSLGRKVLPVLATLLGNDYVDTKIFKSFYTSIWEIEWKSQFSLPEPDKKISKVIPWLESMKTDEEVMSTIKNKGQNVEEKEKISSAFEIITDAFTFSGTENESSLYSFFRGELSNTVKKPIRGFNGSEIPNWYVCKHRQGFLPPRSIDIITLHRTFLTPQMENLKSPVSSYQCSEKLRGLIYGILLSEELLELKEELRTEKRQNNVEEYDHLGNFETGRFVNPLQTLTQWGTLPKLSEIEDLPTEDKEKILDTILNIHTFSKFKWTKDLELVMGIILFWIKESEPNVTQYHLKSVIICMIMLKVKWVLFHSGATGCEENLIETAVRSLTKEDLNDVSTEFKTYDAAPRHSKKNPVDCELIHGFAQLQTCIMATMHLNSLLLDPFPSPCIPQIFSGTFLYNICLDLKEQENPDALIHKLLSKYSKLTEAYQCLLNAVMEALDQEGTADKYFNESWNSKQSSGQRRRPHPDETTPLTTSNKYACLSRSESESDD